MTSFIRRNLPRDDAHQLCIVDAPGAYGSCYSSRGTDSSHHDEERY